MCVCVCVCVCVWDGSKLKAFLTSGLSADTVREA